MSFDQQGLVWYGFAVRFGFSASGEGLTLETSAIHQTSQAKNIPYQPLLIQASVHCKV